MTIEPLHPLRGAQFDEPARPRRLGTIDEADRLMAMRLGFWVGLPLFGLLLAAINHYHAAGRLSMTGSVVLLVLALPLTALVVWLQVRLINRTADGVAFMVGGGGVERTGRGYSLEESLVMRDRIADAVAAYRARIVEEPDNMETRLRLAELAAGQANDPAMARELLLSVRRRAPTPQHERRIGAALVALHRATGDRAALKAELAEQARRAPDSASGRSALRLLRELTRDDAARDAEPPRP